MSAARVTTHKSVIPGKYNVRYGTPSSFDFLGTVQLTEQPACVGRWLAHTADGKVSAAQMTRGDAVAFLVNYARLRR